MTLQEMIADNICRARNEQKMSVAVFAKALGWQRQRVYAVESGQVTISADTIEHIAKTLKVHPDVLTQTGNLVGR